MKFLFLIILFLSILNLPNVASENLAISESKFYFNLEAGKKDCRDIVIFSDDRIKVNIDDKWAFQSYPTLKGYKFNSSELEINFEYPREIEFKENKKIKLCLSGKNKELENHLNSTKVMLLGNSINIPEEKKINNKNYVFISTLILFFILFIALITFKNIHKFKNIEK